LASHRRVIVTGAAGFIGFHLARRLLSEGTEVVGIDNMITGSRENARDLAADRRYTQIEADITEPIDVPGPVNCIYNLACPASPVDFEPHAIAVLQTCSQGVHRMLELARQKGAVFCHASTSECYGDPDPGHHPQREDYWGHVNPIGPRSPYDEGKRYAEALTMAYHRKHGLPTRIARIFNTYGPRMRASDGRVLPNFINQALREKPLTVYGDGSQTRSFCDVGDLVEGIVLLAASDHHAPVNLGNPTEVSIKNVAQEVIGLCGSSSEIAYRPLPADDPQRRQPDISLAKRVLGWEPRTDRRTGFARTIQYFRAQASCS
jgi:dTDP-glucose 4,6-dehydratase